VQVFDKQFDDGEEVYVETSNYTKTVISLNEVKLGFPSPSAGIAQCVSFASRNITNPGLHETAVVTLSDMQLTSSGELTIATLSSAVDISLTINFRSPITGTDTAVLYDNIDNVPSVASAWAGTNKVFIGGKTYTVRSFNLLEGLPSEVLSGSQLSFSGISTQQRQNLILLSKSPFTSVDRVYDQYIDMGTLSTTQPELYYSTGNAFSSPDVLKTTYPLIFVVE
jgi:hypothetical protein